MSEMPKPIEGYLDRDLYDAQVAIEEEHKTALRRMAAEWEDKNV